MSASLKVVVQALIAGADLSAYKYCQVKFGADGRTVVLCGDGERAMGVLQNAPGLGETAEVAVDGGALVKAGGAVSKGASCQSGALGVASDAGAAKWCIGQFQDDGVLNDIVPIIIDRHNSPA